MFMTVLKMTRESILSAEYLLDINSSNSVHKWLTAQQNSNRKDAQLLYRIITKQDQIYIYIQSKDKFNLANIDKVGFVFVKQFEFEPNKVGIYTFDLKAFPCKTIDNRKLFLKDINNRYAWLQRQFEKHHIQLLECQEYDKTHIMFDKDKCKRIESTTYRGKIYAQDVEALNELIINGLGRFKNYGLGLLLIM